MTHLGKARNVPIKHCDAANIIKIAAFFKSLGERLCLYL